MSFSGALVQNAIYIAGEPHPLVTADDWEAAARAPTRRTAATAGAKAR